MRRLALLALPALLLTMASAAAVAPCLPGCDIQGSGLVGFVPPVAVVPSGGAVTWSGLDELPHVNIEGHLGGADSCFRANFQGEHGSTVRFAIVDGALVATQGSTSAVCAQAVVVGNVAVVGYECLIHPLFMKGTLVVLG